MNNKKLHNDDFFERAEKTQQKMALIGFAFFIFGILLVSVILYFFLAAAGVVPPLDVIPFVPYV